MNIEQVGGVSIPKKLDNSDLKKSGGLGKVLQRLNIIFEQTNKKLRGENTSVAGQTGKELNIITQEIKRRKTA